MFSLDYNFLQSVGLGGLPAQDRDSMLEHIREQLEQRVGERLAARMTPQQSSDFLKLIEANDRQAAVGWLRKNLPEHQQVVQEEIAGLSEEIKANAGQIIQATHQANQATTTINHPHGTLPPVPPSNQQVGSPPPGIAA